MSPTYKSLALSYREWHHKVTPMGWEHMFDPAIGLAALLAVNVFSLLLLVPPRALPTSLFLALPLLCGVAAYWYITSIYRAHPGPATYAKLSDNVPGLRKFPLVYGYMSFSLLLFVGCAYAAVRSAA